MSSSYFCVSELILELLELYPEASGTHIWAPMLEMCHKHIHGSRRGGSIGTEPVTVDSALQCCENSWMMLPTR